MMMHHTDRRRFDAPRLLLEKRRANATARAQPRLWLDETGPGDI